MRLTRATGIAAVASFAAIVVAYLSADTYTTKSWVSNAAFTWCAVFALWSCLRAWRTMPTGGRTAWLVMSLCCAFWLAPQLRLDYVMLVRRERSGDLSEFASLSYLLSFAAYFVVYPGFFVALSNLLRDKPREGFDRRVALDIALITLTVGGLGYAFLESSYSAWLAQPVAHGTLQWLAIFGLPLMGLLVFWLILLRMIRQTGIPLATAGVAVVGVVLFAAGDVSYSWQLVRNSQSNLGGPVDLLWDAGLLLVAVAAASSPRPSSASRSRGRFPKARGWS